MVQLILGVKGTGKTKLLIDMVNKALDATKGDVVCIEKGKKLIHEVKYQARLIDSDEYLITNGQMLYGFVSGIFASNHDVTDIFIDSAIKMCNRDVEDFASFVEKVDAFVQTHNINIVITSSLTDEMIPERIKGYMVEYK